MGYVRRNFLVPIPRVESFAALDHHLERKCLGRMNATLRGRNKSIGRGWSKTWTRCRLCSPPPAMPATSRPSVPRCHSCNPVPKFAFGSYPIMSSNADSVMAFYRVGGGGDAGVRPRRLVGEPRSRSGLRSRSELRLSATAQWQPPGSPYRRAGVRECGSSSRRGCCSRFWRRSRFGIWCCCSSRFWRWRHSGYNLGRNCHPLPYSGWDVRSLRRYRGGHRNCGRPRLKHSVNDGRFRGR